MITVTRNIALYLLIHLVLIAAWAASIELLFPEDQWILGFIICSAIALAIVIPLEIWVRRVDDQARARAGLKTSRRLSSNIVAVVAAIGIGYFLDWQEHGIYWQGMLLGAVLGGGITYVRSRNRLKDHRPGKVFD